jgi:hypothetical protein
MLINERISVVVSLTLIGLTLYFVLAFPNQPANFTLFGTPLGVVSVEQWLAALLLGGMAMAGADAVIRVHPALPSRNILYLMTFWMLPGLLIILATQTLGLAPDPLTWGLSLVAVGLLLWLTLKAEFQQVAIKGNRFHWSYAWQQLIGYMVALLFFILIYRTRSRSAISATSMMLVAGMIALALLRHQPGLIGKSWLFAFIISLSLGQFTWALNYWRISALTTGLLLLLALYLLVGLAQQQLLGKLSQRALWEFGSVAVVALLVIFNFT